MLWEKLRGKLRMCPHSHTLTHTHTRTLIKLMLRLHCVDAVTVACRWSYMDLMMIMVAAVVSKWLCSLSGELLDVLVGPPHWLSVVIMASSKSNSTDRGATIPKKQQKATHFVVTTSVLCSSMSWAYFCCCSSWHCELHLNSGTQ